MICPVCETENEENVKNCKECNFEFVYFLSKPTKREEENYNLKIEYFNLKYNLIELQKKHNLLHKKPDKVVNQSLHSKIINKKTNEEVIEFNLEVQKLLSSLKY